mgnify:CR=1 FL=1|tara:strand:+ start:289 stop:630 length:342 start_codon:yes stop_codon:yes gene_type:complete
MIFLKPIKTMKKIRYISLFLFLISCAAAEDAKKVFKNEKVKTTDEFLVKKKQPLELPPDYNDIPKPNSLEEKNNKKDLEEKSIKEILNADESLSKSSSKGSTTEQSIINQIRK